MLIAVYAFFFQFQIHQQNNNIRTVKAYKITPILSHKYPKKKIGMSNCYIQSNRL